MLSWATRSVADLEVFFSTCRPLFWGHPPNTVNEKSGRRFRSLSSGATNGLPQCEFTTTSVPLDDSSRDGAKRGRHALSAYRPGVLLRRSSAHEQLAKHCERTVSFAHAPAACAFWQKYFLRSALRHVAVIFFGLLRALAWWCLVKIDRVGLYKKSFSYSPIHVPSLFVRQ